jgi:glycosyltransferase involved in cell wall biosynthesis
MKIVWLSDLDLRGSGYKNLSVPICEGLVKRGHEVMAVGLGYNNEEHDFPFALLPAGNLNEAAGSAKNLQNMWGAEVLIVALDIPIQEQIMRQRYFHDRTMKYVGLFPVEAPPLCISWAMVLMQMDKQLVISEFGTKAAQEAGVNASYVQIGLDTESWKPVSQEEKVKMRQAFGFDKDTFVVLTVADNQERKNLTAAMDMFAEFSKDKENVKYVLVTREHNRVGWKLRDYAQELGISENFMIFERGMPFSQLWTTYAVSDVFLLPSKSEGLGMPLLEAMAVGVPCIATNCTGMAELLGEDRGFLLDYAFTHRDPFGNGWRYWVDKKQGIEALEFIYKLTPKKNIEKARKYVEERTWDVAVDQVEKALQEVCGKPEPSEFQLISGG